MKYIGYLLISLLIVFSSSVNAQSPCKGDGICVVQFNAGFNEANKVTWLGELKECSKKFIDIQRIFIKLLEMILIYLNY